jgi:hypothetical protein
MGEDGRPPPRSPLAVGRIFCCGSIGTSPKIGDLEEAEARLKIRAGYDIAFSCSQEVPILLMLSVHPSRQQDLLTDHVIRVSPTVEARDFRDAFGNVCTRLVAPPGLIKLSNEFLISDSGPA